jgi:ribosomal protein L11 methyltransferase
MLFKLRIAVPDLDTGRSVAGLLNEAVVPEPLAVTLFEDKPPAHIVEAYYGTEPPLGSIAPRLAELHAELGVPRVERVPDENWVTLSQAALPPIGAGRFLVHGSHDRPRFAMRPAAVEIDAGEAFGTGHNATTVLCLEAIDRLSHRLDPIRILDLGCGTAVLAIAAARVFPAARVLAVDNDPIATAVARANVRLNRSGRRIRVLTASGFAHAASRAFQPLDLILANILPRPLIALAPAMARALRSGGIAVLSGLLDHQARQVCATYAAAGFHLVNRSTRSGWTALTLVRRRRREVGRPNRR